MVFYGSIYGVSNVIGIASVDLSSSLLATISVVLPSAGDGYLGRFMNPTQIYYLSSGGNFYTYKNQGDHGFNGYNRGVIFTNQESLNCQRMWRYPSTNLSISTNPVTLSTSSYASFTTTNAVIFSPSSYAFSNLTLTNWYVLPSGECDASPLGFTPVTQTSTIL